MIYANDPDLLGSHDPDQIGMVQLGNRSRIRAIPGSHCEERHQLDMVAAASAAWARKVFPEVGPMSRWRGSGTPLPRSARLDHPDPTAACARTSPRSTRARITSMPGATRRFSTPGRARPGTAELAAARCRGRGRNPERSGCSTRSGGARLRDARADAAGASEFPKRTVDLMQTFANQSVLAIQNARLFREIEDKSRQLEIASQHKSQFLANMSHELRTPLNAVLGYTEMLLDGVYGEVTGEAHEILEYIQANGQHLLALINDVLDLSKIEAGQLTLALDEYAVQSVVEAVVSVAQPLAQAKGLDLKVSVAEDLPLGRGDERRLTQVLLNLVGNAIKFTDAGSVTIAAMAVGDLLELAVTDTGPGIAPADQERIFDAFQQVDNSSTRQKGGTGLGLAISRRIVQMHGGTISVESTLGQGSTFRIRIPLQAGGVMEAA